MKSAAEYHLLKILSRQTSPYHWKGCRIKTEILNRRTT
nr:MAG TPA: hypothetical protein [Caudoviricetes sp.]